MANVIARSGWFASIAARLVRGCLFAGLGLAAWSAFAAERFEDIAVSPQVFFQGQTYHGYVEMRFSVENQSLDRTRQIGRAHV